VISLSTGHAEERVPGGYRVYEAMAATVNGEVLFLSDVAREACLRGCGAFPGDGRSALSLSEARDRLIADILVRQEEEKLGLIAVDNASLQEAAARGLDIMRNCPSPCSGEVSGEQVREYAARRLLVREFLRKRVAGFVEVSEEAVQREIQRRSSRLGIPVGDIPAESVRQELVEEEMAREVRNWFDRATSKSKIYLSPLEER
jgi:hypothetical protein